MMKYDAVGRSPSGTRPRRLVIARATLRVLGDASLARIAGGRDTLHATCQTCVSEPDPGCTQTCTCPGQGCLPAMTETC